VKINYKIDPLGFTGGFEDFKEEEEMYLKFQAKYEDFFEKSNSIKGKDILQNLKISFLESALGCKKEISYTRDIICKSCNGTKAEPDTQIQQCHSCEGRGKVFVKQKYFNVGVKCNFCNGAGVIIIDPCKLVSITFIFNI